MRVKDGDGRDAPERLDRLDHSFIEQRQAVRKDVGLRRPQKRNKARWPMAKCGSMPRPISSGSLT